MNDLGRDTDIEVGSGKCIKDTEKAVLVQLDDTSEEVNLPSDKLWIPKSQLSDDSEVYGEGDEGRLLVTRWWARKEGWI